MKHCILKKSVSLAMVMVLGVTVLSGCAGEEAKADNIVSDSEDVYVLAEGTGFGYKSETVYVTTDANGLVTDITVSDWLRNMDNVGELKDVTNLSKIVNVKGDEEFDVSGGLITFKTDGRDIYYQGKAEKTARIPVELGITYTLDGKAVDGEELNGKSGHLVMTIEYKATETAKVTIDGEEQEVVLPFLAITGMLFPADRFDNVTVKSGMLLSNGNEKIVAGYGLPGISEEKVVVEADVKDFEMSMMMTVVTNSFLSKINEEDIENAESSEELSQIISQAAGLHEGILDVYKGIISVDENMTKLQDGVSQVCRGSEVVNESVSEIGNGAGKLADGAALIDSGVDRLVLEMSTLYKEICVTLDTYKAVIEENKGLIDGLNAAVAAGDTSMINSETLAKIEGYYQMTGAYGALSQIKEQLEAKDEYGRDVFENLAMLASGTEELALGGEALFEGADRLYKTGTSVLVAALKELEQGSMALQGGTNQLAQGTTQMSAGLSEMFDIEYIRAVKAASEEYKSFTGIDDKQDGEVKFIIKSR